MERNRVLAAMTVQGKKWYNVPLGFLEQRRCFGVMLAKRCSEGNYFDWQKYFAVGVRRWTWIGQRLSLAR